MSAKKPLSSAALVVYAFAVALGLGVGSAYVAVSGDYPFGGVRLGPWKAWPRVGSPQADPYARAIVTRRGDIPLAVGEGLAFTAAEDSAGRPLNAACAYRIGAQTPQARLWTLTLYGPDGALAATQTGRSGFTSAELLREQDGRFAIALSRDVRPGNWLQLPSSERFTVVIRLYDTPVAAGAASLEAAVMPSIERLECSA